MLPEQAQRLFNFRERVLLNKREGKPSHDGITAEEIQACIEILRQGRVNCGPKPKTPKEKAAKKKAAATVKTVTLSQEKLDFFKNLNLD